MNVKGLLKSRLSWVVPVLLFVGVGFYLGWWDELFVFASVFASNNPLAVYMFIGLLIIIVWKFNPIGRLSLPDLANASISDAFDSMAKGGWYDHRVASVLSDWYGMPLLIPNDLSRSIGVYHYLCKANKNFIPEGLSRIMLLTLKASMVATPLGKSRVVGFCSLKDAYELNNAKKLGDVTYEYMGSLDESDRTRKWLERNPWAIEGFQVSGGMPQGGVTPHG